MVKLRSQNKITDFVMILAWASLFKYELSQKKCFIFFPGTKKMFVSRSVIKKNCVLIFQKKNITESNNLAPPPPRNQMVRP